MVQYKYMVVKKQPFGQPYQGFFGDWAMTISALLALSFIGAAVVLSAEAQPAPRQIYLQKPKPQVLSTSTYIYDAPVQ